MTNKDGKELTYVRGYVVEIFEPKEVILRGQARKTIMFTMETQCGQTLVLETREKNVFQKLEEYDIKTDDAIEVGFIFHGTTSYGKAFNNLQVRWLELI